MGLGAKSAYADAEWHLWGDQTTGVEWNVDNDKLIIRPVNGAEGTMPDVNNVYGTSLPWNDQKGSITTVEFQGSIKSSENLKGLFRQMRSLRSINFGNFDTSRATDISGMFYICPNLTSLDLSNFNTSSVTDMTAMFRNCPNLTSLDLSNFNTSSVTHMNFMFNGCSSLTSLDLSNFNTSKVTNMGNMFSGCSNLTSLDLSNFNTSSVTNMEEMFYSCPNLTSLNLSSFDTSNVTGMSFMFRDCPNLTSLDLSSFDTSNVTGMTFIFYNCANLTTIYVSSGWNTDSVVYFNDIFYNCTNLQGGNGTRFDGSAPKDKTRAHIDGVGGQGYLTLGYEASSLPTFNGSSLTYGDRATIQGGANPTFGQGTSKVSVEGTWSVNTNRKPQAGDTKLSVVFTPNDPSTHQKYYTTITIPQVSKRTITGVTPESDQFKQYNGQAGADPTLTYEPSGLIDGDTKEEVFTGSLTRQDGYLPGQYNILIGTLNLNTDGKGKNYSFDRTSAFTTGVKFTIKPTGSIPVPKAVDNLVYNKTEQTGIVQPERTTIVAGTNKATNASSNYSVTFKLDPGYVWGESGFDQTDKTVPWTIKKLPVTITAHPQKMYVGDTIPPLTYDVSEPDFKNEITGSLRVDGDINVVDEYNIVSDLTSDNLDLSNYIGAKITVEAKPVFPGGGGDTPGPINPNDPDNPNNPNNPHDPNDPNNPNTPDPNGSNTPAIPTDPSVPTTSGTPGWSHINGNWYYYNQSGTLISGWISDSYHWYYLSPEGIMYTSWNYIDNTWYYFNDAGQMQTGWVYVDDTWYYLDNSGAMQTGWIYTDDTWYLTDTSGAMKTGWEYVDGAWYHLDQTGAMTVGWYSDGYNWYYLNTSGEMATGTHSIDGQTYTFASSGEWVA